MHSARLRYGYCISILAAGIADEAVYIFAKRGDLGRREEVVGCGIGSESGIAATYKTGVLVQIQGQNVSYPAAGDIMTWHGFQRFSDIP